ncbi:MAG TPA: hypothetical protein VMV21_02325 [Vicinamibacteria bacterium]|nr:hypothetical protein [Vicinamibacteria bacterium]
MRMWRRVALIGLPLLALQLAGAARDGSSPDPARALSLVFVVAGVFFLVAILEELFGAAVALWTGALVLYGTVLLSYVVQVGNVSGALAFCAAAAALRVWWPARRGLSPGRGLLLGLLLGVGAALRAQYGMLLLLPAATLLLDWRRGVGRTVRTAVLLGGAFLAVALPPTWGAKAGLSRALRGSVPTMLARLDDPRVLLTFFSSRHGLLYWTPVLWGGFLGLFLLSKRDRFTALALAVPLVVLSYINACSGGEGSAEGHANGRFDPALPLLALGLGAALAWARETAGRRPLRVTWAAGLFFVLWNLLLIVQYRERLPADDTVSFAAVTENNARIFVRYAGTPLAWPANWIFARAQELPPLRFDLLVGRYLFEEKDPLGGRVAVGDGRTDPLLFAGEWSAPAPCGEALCREVQGRARVMVPLLEPMDLDVVVHAFGRGTLSVTINGTEMASFPLSGEPRDLRVRVPRPSWRHELNDLVLEVGAGDSAFVEFLAFERTAEATTARERLS